METDKSEGRTRIHQAKTIFTKYLILAISFRDNNLYILFLFLYYIYKKNAFIAK